MCLDVGIENMRQIEKEWKEKQKSQPTHRVTAGEMMQATIKAAMEREKQRENKPTLKVTVHEDESVDNQEWNYPLLVKSIHDGAIVFATSDSDDDINFSGTLIEKSGDFRPIGYFSPLWDKDSFKPFRGKVVLSNE